MSRPTTPDLEAWETDGGADLRRLGIHATLMKPTLTEAIATGSILMEGGVRLPDRLLLQGGSEVNGWAAVNANRSTFEKELQEAGWTFFFMAGEIQATVFGFDGQKALRTVLNRLIGKAKSQGCNSVEIVQITRQSFLRVPYLSVSAHLRHLQKGLVFSGHR